MAKEENYCAFLGGPCNKNIPPKNDFKLFIAYPSEDKIKGYIKAICKKEVLSGLDLFPWENLSYSGGIIFCKICQNIIEAHSIVADITYINQNVLFELGFGIGVGKLPILIRESNRDSKIIDILKDITRIEYDDLDALANKLSKAFFEESPLLDVIEETNADDNATVFFINADANMPVKRPIYKYLDKFSQELSYKIEIDDSSEMFSHKLLSLLKTINASEMVICHMVGTDYQGYNEINAHVAFLAGYALAKEKKLLVLQECPSDKMIDLQNVRHEYKDKDGAIKILGNWLRPFYESRKKVLAQASHSKEYIALQKEFTRSLGHPAAEYDSILEECFLTTHEYSDAKNLQKHLFVGRKGTGKTANLFQLSKAFEVRSNKVVVNIIPSKLQLISAIDKLYSAIGEERITALFEMFWQYLILTEIAIACRNFESRNFPAEKAESFNIVSKLLRQHIYTDVEFDIRFNSMIDQFCKLAIQANKGSMREEILQKFYKEYFPEMRKAIKDISEKYPIIVLIDDLDRDWYKENIAKVSALINSLFEVMNKVNMKNDFGDCNVICFLRTDIYQISSGSDPDRDKRQPVLLRWDKEMLKSLICERVASVKSIIDYDEDELWESIFGFSSKSIPDSFEYIVQRTMLRPRDILKFCSLIMENMNKLNKDSINEKVLLESEKTYSEYLLESIRQEYRIGYPDIKEICRGVFDTKKPKFTESELRKRLQEYLISNSSNSIDEIVEFCFQCGVLGFFFQGKTYFEYNGKDYNSLMQKARKEQDGVHFVLHPGLYKYLEIS